MNIAEIVDTEYSLAKLGNSYSVKYGFTQVTIITLYTVIHVEGLGDLFCSSCKLSTSKANAI